jgi:hypothetical protein
MGDTLGGSTPAGQPPLISMSELLRPQGERCRRSTSWKTPAELQYFLRRKARADACIAAGIWVIVYRGS